MSVLKSILHHWNSTNKAYDTLHPETEAAQVTDWHESVIGSLASKVLPTVVSELTTDSVMGKLMKMLLTASGVKYSIDTNGYVCLGSFFGGLIIQWGRVESTMVFTYPIGFKAQVVYVSSIHVGESSDPNRTISLGSLGLNSVKVLTSTPNDHFGFLLAIGY